MTKSYGKGVRLAALGLAAATVLSLAAPAFAGEKPAAKKGHGVMAAIDATGKLRQPTAAESKALAAGVESMLKSSASSLQAKQTADGTMSVDLGTSFLNISIAQVGPDGVLQQICLDNAADANALVNAAPLFEDK
ncbi:MAG: post-PEP-CTERM-1 domain-containing protein [Thermoanaerobaculia bacterium]